MAALATGQAQLLDWHSKTLSAQDLWYEVAYILCRGPVSYTLAVLATAATECDPPMLIPQGVCGMEGKA